MKRIITLIVAIGMSTAMIQANNDGTTFLNELAGKFVEGVMQPSEQQQAPAAAVQAQATQPVVQPAQSPVSDFINSPKVQAAVASAALIGSAAWALYNKVVKPLQEGKALIASDAVAPVVATQPATQTQQVQAPVVRATIMDACKAHAGGMVREAGIMLRKATAVAVTNFSDKAHGMIKGYFAAQPQQPVVQATQTTKEQVKDELQLLA